MPSPVVPLNGEGDVLVVVAEFAADNGAALLFSQAARATDPHFFSVEATVIEHFGGHYFLAFGLSALARHVHKGRASRGARGRSVAENDQRDLVG